MYLGYIIIPFIMFFAVLIASYLSNEGAVWFETVRAKPIKAIHDNKYLYTWYLNYTLLTIAGLLTWNQIDNRMEASLVLGFYVLFFTLFSTGNFFMWRKHNIGAFVIFILLWILTVLSGIYFWSMISIVGASFLLPVLAWLMLNWLFAWQTYQKNK